MYKEGDRWLNVFNHICSIVHTIQECQLLDFYKKY